MQRHDIRRVQIEPRRDVAGNVCCRETAVPLVIRIVTARRGTTVRHAAHHIDIHARANQIEVQSRPVAGIPAPGDRITQRHDPHRCPASLVAALQAYNAVRIVTAYATVRQHTIVHSDLVDSAGKVIIRSPLIQPTDVETCNASEIASIVHRGRRLLDTVHIQKILPAYRIPHRDQVVPFPIPDVCAADQVRSGSRTARVDQREPGIAARAAQRPFQQTGRIVAADNGLAGDTARRTALDPGLDAEARAVGPVERTVIRRHMTSWLTPSNSWATATRPATGVGQALQVADGPPPPRSNSWTRRFHPASSSPPSPPAGATPPPVAATVTSTAALSFVRHRIRLIQSAHTCRVGERAATRPRVERRRDLQCRSLSVASVPTAHNPLALSYVVPEAAASSSL